jgi:hypothetical protein
MLRGAMEYQGPRPRYEAHVTPNNLMQHSPGCCMVNWLARAVGQGRVLRVERGAEAVFQGRLHP